MAVLKPGDRVRVVGRRTVTGTITAATPITLTIKEAAAGFSFLLRRNLADTNPDQWRWGGLPCVIFRLPDEDFRRRLAALITKGTNDGSK